MKIHHGDCLKILKTLRANSVHSIVTDPPYGLSFMGKKWDYAVPSVEVWKECLRVLKPGGHLLAFGGTRTYHRLVVNIEDAGFEIRDQIMWIYASGFPKSHNIAKSIDKELGVEPTVVGKIAAPASTKRVTTMGRPDHSGSGWNEEPDLTAATSPEAKQWSGWGTALKPANEPICLARKPLSEKTVAKNVLKHGVGGLNVDASRISTEGQDLGDTSRFKGQDKKAADGWMRPHKEDDEAMLAKQKSAFEKMQSSGRFPANILFDEAAAAVLDEQSGILKSGTLKGTEYLNGKVTQNAYGSHKGHASLAREGDSGGASRFFYVAKASKRDRGEGNTHPTVKPIKLMEYLVRLVTPEGGIVLDPFMGSGTTGVASQNLKLKFVGIEKERKYVTIAKRRMKV